MVVLLSLCLDSQAVLALSFPLLATKRWLFIFVLSTHLGDLVKFSGLVGGVPSTARATLKSLDSQLPDGFACYFICEGSVSVVILSLHILVQLSFAWELNSSIKNLVILFFDPRNQFCTIA